MAKLAAFPKGFLDRLTSGEMSLDRWLELAAGLDVDGVELYPRFLESLDDRRIGRLKRRIEGLGLEMPMMCHSPDFTRRDRRDRLGEIEASRRMIDVTAALGGRYCRVLSGQRRPDVDEEEGLAWVIEALEALLSHAERVGVILTLENHYKDGSWEYPEFAQSSERYLRILDTLPSPWLLAQYDPSNALVAGEDPYALLERVAPRVATVHASDRYLEGGGVEDLRRFDRDPVAGYAGILKHGVIGEGLNDFDRIFAALRDSGFDGWVSIEDGEGPTLEIGMENLRKSAAFLRRKMKAYFQTGETTS